jgi:DNA-binding beta-propeller fold protein YncE
VLTVLPLAAPAGAQVDASHQTVAVPQVDSARNAREAYRRAVTAYRQHDLATARAEMLRAAESWSTQQAYLDGAAKLAAMAHDTVEAIRWLRRLAELGVGSDVRDDTTFRVLLGVPAFDSAASSLAVRTAPIVRGRVRLTVADTTLHPEGIAFDPRHRRWFMGSVRKRKVVAIDRDGGVRDFVASAADGLAGVFGMAVDSARHTLWVATTALPRMDRFTDADSGHVGVYGYDLETGRLQRKAWMSRDSSTAHTFGDVAVAPNGDVYVSDSQAPWILVLPAGDDSLARFLTHPLFRSLQGMAITPDGASMYVADYSHGLLRVSLASTTVSALVAPPGVTLLGVDGLYWHRGALIGVQNGVTPTRVVRFCLDPSGRSVRRLEVLDRNPAVADEPTLGAIEGDSLVYVATSAWEKYDDDGKRVAGTKLRPAIAVSVPLASSSDCLG